MGWLKYSLADVKQVHFEDRLKVYLLEQALMDEKSKDAKYSRRLTWGARNELPCKVANFSETTRQLIIRSNWDDLIRMVMRLHIESDVRYAAEIGDLEMLQCAQVEHTEKVIPVILKRTKDIPDFLCSHIVKFFGTDLEKLYSIVADTHKEFVNHILSSENCSPDLFVQLFNERSKEESGYVDPAITKRLFELMSTGRVSVKRIPSIVKETS